LKKVLNITMRGRSSGYLNKLTEYYYKHFYNVLNDNVYRCVVIFDRNIKQMAVVRIQLLCGQTQRRSTDIGSEQNRCPFPPYRYPCE